MSLWATMRFSWLLVSLAQTRAFHRVLFSLGPCLVMAKGEPLFLGPAPLSFPELAV